MTTDQDYIQNVEAWRSKRLLRLAAEDGWLNIVGRWELEPGSVTLGAGSDNDVVFPVGPDRVGTLTQDAAGGVMFTPADGGAPIRLALDKKNPPRFSAGRLLLEVTTLNGLNALRVRDREAPERRAWPTVPHFPVDPKWRVVADWAPLDKPLTAGMVTSTGIPTEVAITHRATFTHDGTRYGLLPTHGTPEAPQFVLRDRTAGTETYPASRFLYGEDIGQGTMVLDFNKAINPPCAFTDYAVCPLPPPQNILPFRIDAGELKLPK